MALVGFPKVNNFNFLQFLTIYLSNILVFSRQLGKPIMFSCFQVLMIQI